MRSFSLHSYFVCEILCFFVHLQMCFRYISYFIFGIPCYWVTPRFRYVLVWLYYINCGIGFYLSGSMNVSCCFLTCLVSRIHYCCLFITSELIYYRSRICVHVKSHRVYNPHAFDPLSLTFTQLSANSHT